MNLTRVELTTVIPGLQHDNRARQVWLSGMFMTADKQLLDNLTTAVIVLDAQLQVTAINHAAEALLETSGQRSLRAPLAALFLGDHKLEGLTEALADGSSYRKRGALLQLATGSEVTVDYSIAPIDIDGSRALLLELQNLDRLIRISREETRLNSQHTTRNLIRSLAHEIKNPLGGLRGAAQLLERQLPDDSLKDYTGVIIEEADRLRKLVDRLLGPHKVSDLKPLNIHEVLERVRSLVSAETGDSITIARDYDPSIPEITGDAEQLIQAVLNIVRNAAQSLENHNRKDGESAGNITLQSRIQRHFTIGQQQHRLLARISIIDNGPGIDADLIDTIFFPLISGRADGTGLGLSIAQSILQQHRGLIECQSEPGNTEFTLYIPLEPGDE